MKLYLCKEFLTDLIEHNSPEFAKRALRKVVDRHGEFIQQVHNDHRHDGVDDAWIRYISTGNTAFRLIFIRNDKGIYVYRAGEHNVSDHLTAPGNLDEAVEIIPAPAEAQAIRLNPPRTTRFLGSIEPRPLIQFFAERMLIPHKSMVLVSPSISFALLSPVGLIGRLIDRIISGNGTVTLITAPPPPKHLEEFERLANRSIDLRFHSTINARLSLMEVDMDLAVQMDSNIKDAIIIGSAELLEASLGTTNGTTSIPVREDLCYGVPADDYNDAFSYCLRLAEEAVDLPTYRHKIAPPG